MSIKAVEYYAVTCDGDKHNRTVEIEASSLNDLTKKLNKKGWLVIDYNEDDFEWKIDNTNVFCPECKSNNQYTIEIEPLEGSNFLRVNQVKIQQVIEKNGEKFIPIHLEGHYSRYGLNETDGSSLISIEQARKIVFALVTRMWESSDAADEVGKLTRILQMLRNSKYGCEASTCMGSKCEMWNICRNTNLDKKCISYLEEDKKQFEKLIEMIKGE